MLACSWYQYLPTWKEGTLKIAYFVKTENKVFKFLKEEKKDTL